MLTAMMGFRQYFFACQCSCKKSSNVITRSIRGAWLDGDLCAQGDTERTRAWVTFAGFAVLSAVNILLLFVLGDDGETIGVRDSLLGGAGVGESDV